jgi:hypothetical protein
MYHIGYQYQYIALDMSFDSIALMKSSHNLLTLFALLRLRSSTSNTDTALHLHYIGIVRGMYCRSVLM